MFTALAYATVASLTLYTLSSLVIFAMDRRA